MIFFGSQRADVLLLLSAKRVFPKNERIKLERLRADKRKNQEDGVRRKKKD